MKKYLFLVCLFFINISYAQIHFFSDAYDADLCINGKGGTWNGACSCYEPTIYSGRYCSDKKIKDCQQNTDCDSNSYCAFPNTTKNGVCFKKAGYPIIQTKKGAIILSDSIMNAHSAVSFCASLGKDWRMITRADFNCQSLGPACLDFKLLTTLKKSLKSLGFFWLEHRQQSTMFYYADLNDGTVYFTNGQNNTTMQALCIRKDLK